MGFNSAFKGLNTVVMSDNLRTWIQKEVK